MGLKAGVLFLHFRFLLPYPKPIHERKEVLWQRFKMMRRKDATKTGTIVIVTLLHAFSLVACIPRETVFYGADEKKIRETPSFLKICHRNDKHVDKCIKSSLEKFITSMRAAPKEHNLPNIDPIEVPLVEFQQGSGNVSIHFVFKDLRMVGFSHFQITSVRSNLADNKFEISMESPFVNMMAQFSAEGGVYTFPIYAQNDFHLNLTEVSAVLIIRLTTAEDLPGFKYFAVEDCILDLLPSEISADFGEYIDGSNAIGSAFNTFFNNNAHEIFTMIKPKLSIILARIFGDIANYVLSRHPQDVLLPD